MPRPQRIAGASSAKASVDSAVARRVIYPRELRLQLGVSHVTLWRMERDGRVPRKDFFMRGQAVGWKPETLASLGEPEAA